MKHQSVKRALYKECLVQNEENALNCHLEKYILSIFAQQFFCRCTTLICVDVDPFITRRFADPSYVAWSTGDVIKVCGNLRARLERPQLKATITKSSSLLISHHDQLEEQSHIAIREKH